MAKFLDMDGVEYLINSYLKPGFTDIYKNSSKNVLLYNCIGNGGSTWDSTTYTHNGITYTLNADKTISAYGQCDTSNNSFCYLGYNQAKSNIDDYCDGNYILSGCPQGGSSSTWRMYITKTGYNSVSEYGEGSVITDKSSLTGMLICCLIGKNTNIPQNSPIIFHPMICTKDAWKISKSWEPYAMTNYELTNNIATTTEIETMWTNS